LGSSKNALKEKTVIFPTFFPLYILLLFCWTMGAGKIFEERKEEHPFGFVW
jgi:hypothetical protein